MIKNVLFDIQSLNNGKYSCLKLIKEYLLELPHSSKRGSSKKFCTQIHVTYKNYVEVEITTCNTELNI